MATLLEQAPHLKVISPKQAQDLLNRHNALITAPAGHGKTEAIADLVNYSNFQKKFLLLTHTKAGVNALEKRMIKRKIPHDKYTIYTIAGYCKMWCKAYPKTANIDNTLSQYSDNKEEKGKYYNQLYTGACAIFKTPWARKVILSTYSAIIVDEYQDCSVLQHNIFQTVNNFIKLIALGDPLQGIFSFSKDPLQAIVKWDNIQFYKVPEDTLLPYPWRWEYTNKALGDYLKKIRRQLLTFTPGINNKFHIETVDSILEWVPVTTMTDMKDLYCKLYNDISNIYSSAAFITKWERRQQNITTCTQGLFEFTETQEGEDLYHYASLIETAPDDFTKVNYALDFASKCATNVNGLTSYKNRLEKASLDFTRIKKYPAFGKLLHRLFLKTLFDEDQTTEPIYLKLAAILNWIKDEQSIFVYREEMYDAMIQSLKTAVQSGSLTEATKELWEIKTNKKIFDSPKKKNFISSRTLLSKGLEYECVIIDLSKQNTSKKDDWMTSKDFYVAMTRATKKIYVISNTEDIFFSE